MNAMSGNGDSETAAIAGEFFFKGNDDDEDYEDGETLTVYCELMMGMKSKRQKVAPGPPSTS